MKLEIYLPFSKNVTFHAILIVFIINFAHCGTLSHYIDIDLPLSFNLLTSAPSCISKIFNQGVCDTCSWAITAASVFTDRLCLKNQDQLDLVEMNPYCKNYINVKLLCIITEKG